MECDDLIVYLEQPEDLQAIIEVPDDITVNTIESVREVEVPQEMTYTIDFDAYSTQWGFYSKHFGNITSVELTNVASYTIDGAAVTLPKAIELNTTYIIDIVKETSGTAQMIISVMPIDYAEIDSTVDFETGDGSFLYALGSNINVATNRTLLKFDSELLKTSNSLGGGSWIVEPLISTITLPLLPTGGYWRLICYVKSNHIIAIGANSNTIYFCRIDSGENVTDLNGNIDQYSTFTGTNGSVVFTAYDYINNYLYVQTITSGSNPLVMIELNNNTFHDNNSYPLNQISITTGNNGWVSFNPYKNAFFTYAEYDVENKKSLLYPCASFATTVPGVFSIKNKRYIKTNYTRLLCEFDEFGYQRKVFTSAYSPNSSHVNFSYDQVNNVYLSFGSTAYFGIYRIEDNNIKHYNFTDIEAGEIYIRYSCFLKDNIHIGLSNLWGRIHTIDATDPAGTLKADFNYYNLPNKCWHICSNRLL